MVPRLLLGAILLAAIVAGPTVMGGYGLTLGFSLFVYVALAQAWNLIGGYGGQFSLGHAIFVGTGAYALGVALARTGLPVPVALALSGLTATVVAAVSAVPLLRLRSAAFSVGSLGVSLAGLSWMINWSYTGATAGLYLPSEAVLDDTTLYYLAAGLALVTTLSIGLLVRSRFGLRLTAVRDDEDAAAELGINAFLVKLTAFTISAFFTGLAGGVLALQKLSLEPYSAFSLTWTTNMIVMSVTGGLSTIAGPIVGAVVIFGLQQLLLDARTLSTLLTGVLLIVIVRLAPQGLTGAVLARRRRHMQGGPL
jgi:branched-chain amino acid transport system permease protein